jgi:type IV pilus biogenesis protein CpaD/CtpE
MAMSFIEEAASMKIARPILIVAAALGLCACAQNPTQSEMRMSPDFGDAVRENLAAQIADPDARYAGTLAPGASDGARIDLAQTRYQQNQVIQPSTTTASSRGSIGNADNGGGGGAGGAGAGVGAAASSP